MLEIEGQEKKTASIIEMDNEDSYMEVVYKKDKNKDKDCIVVNNSKK